MTTKRMIGVASGLQGTETRRNHANFAANATRFLICSLAALSISVILAATSGAAVAACLTPLGDINGSGSTNVADVQCAQLVVLWSLGGQAGPPPDCSLGDPSRADADCSGAVTVGDVQIFILWATNQPLSPVIDADGNGCPDGCGPAQEPCGDGLCSGGESCLNCAADCGACSGACCSPSQLPGCEESGCENCVCGIDLFCCESAWDYICAVEATEDCDTYCGCPGPGEAPCCGNWVVPGCGTPACESCVCGVDAFCCNVVWDEGCRALAGLDCNGPCGCNPASEASCCEPHQGAGCEGPLCQACVCALDGLCCSASWDNNCTALAAADCLHACGCPGPLDCCSPHNSPGCAAPHCEQAICTADPFCCEVFWDIHCAAQASSLCGPNCDGPGVCPGFGDCCTDNGSWGCADISCCATVCGQDAFCCDVIWDAECAAAASTLCEDLCGAEPPPPPPPACVSAGPCGSSHSGVGCEDGACCESVCAVDSYCCLTQWDEVCASLAHVLCGGPPPPACPAPGDCCGAHAGAGCSDTNCCETVCAQDSYCCEVSWDLACAADAASLCAALCPVNPPIPADESCAGHCDDFAPSGCYCDAVCPIYGDCCDDACDVCGYCQ